jgi:hypothetical protein
MTPHSITGLERVNISSCDTGRPAEGVREKREVEGQLRKLQLVYRCALCPFPVTLRDCETKCRHFSQCRPSDIWAPVQSVEGTFTSKLFLNLRTKLVKCYIWSIALYGAETWTLRKIYQKYLGSFEMWC